jgi:hypothetical protein
MNANFGTFVSLDTDSLFRNETSGLVFFLKIVS